MGLRGDLGIQPEQDVERSRPRKRSGDPHERLRLIRRFDRDPPDRVADGRRSNGRPEVRVGLADALERDAAVRDAGPPGDRPLAARDNVRIESQAVDPGHDRADVVGLDRERAEPRVRERRPNLGRGMLEGGEVRDPDGRPEAASGEPEGGREAIERLAVVRRRGHDLD
jgi:hypothetical protein